jgi:hypothetical protein
VQKVPQMSERTQKNISVSEKKKALMKYIKHTTIKTIGSRGKREKEMRFFIQHAAGESLNAREMQQISI